MAEFNDDNLDALLTRHLATELDPQLGRAEFAFAQYQQSGSAAAPLHPDERPYPIRPGSQPFRGWMIGLIGAGLAASIGALVAGPRFFQQQPTESAPSGRGHTQLVDPRRGNGSGEWSKGFEPLRSSEQSPMLRYVHSRTLDEGTVILNDHTPARQLRHQGLQRTEWYDPATHARMEVVIPREDVTYMKMDTY